MEKYEVHLLKEWEHDGEKFPAHKHIRFDDDELFKTLTEGDDPIGVTKEAWEEGLRKEEQAKLDAEDAEKKAKSEKSVVTKVHQRTVDHPMYGYKSFGALAVDIKGCGKNSLTWDPRLRAAQAELKAISGMSEFQDSEGGILVPDVVDNDIREIVHAEDNLITRTETMTTSGNAMTLKTNSETSRATGSRWGGFRGYWLDEADQFTAMTAKFDKMELKLRKVGVFAYVTDELLEDADIALGSYLSRGAGREINFMISDSIINGDGANKPLGILNASSLLVSVAKEGGQAATTIVSENIIKMYARMWSGSLGNSIWLINQDTFPQLVTMTLDVGTGGVPLYMPPGGLSQAPFGTIFGRPVLPVEWCPTLGTVGDIIFADLSQYVSITKGTIQSATSIHLRFDYAETAFRFTFRLDGMPSWKSSLTPFKGTANTVGPFVALATRS